MATNLAEGALVAWQVPPEKLEAAFDYLFQKDPFSGHVVTRSTDAATPGSGHVFDWDLAQGPTGIRLILAGGLTPENVAAAIAQVHPWGVDVVSGVEYSPGRKDAVKVRAFVAAAKAAAPDEPDQEEEEEAS